MVQSVQIVQNVQAFGYPSGSGAIMTVTIERLERASGPLHLAAASWIGERLVGDAHELVFTANDFPEINVLNRIVRLRHCPGTARTIDFCFFHGRDDFFPLADVAFDGLQSGSKQQSGIVALDRIYVGRKSIRLRVGATKL